MALSGAGLALDQEAAEMIAADVGKTFTLGKYMVRIALRPDNPAFARYLVFHLGKLVGHQFSRPSEADCRWLERWVTGYADESRWVQTSTLCQRKRGGRTSKEVAERQLHEAMAS